MRQDTAITAFLAIFLADFFARTAYMTAKSPVLPVFAGQIGASEILLGLILAVSTFSGMMLKPLFGFLSDRQGRWVWLVVGTTIFAATPVLYLGVASTEALLGLRLFHGVATAIYGPVTLAYVAGLSTQPKAEFFGWFGLSRTAAYILGPLIGGAMLMWVSPTVLLAATSAIAVLAFIPVLYLGRLEDNVQRSRTRIDRVPVRQLLQAVYANRPLLSVGLVEMLSRIGVYAVKAFIPLVILGGGGTVMQAGLFLSVQELAVALTRPIAGRLADRFDAAAVVATFGLLGIAIALVLVPHTTSVERLVMLAIMIGGGNGAYHPAALALISGAANPDMQGFSFGVVGALRNMGKLLGPVLGGSLLYSFSPEVAFATLGGLTYLAVLPLLGHRMLRVGAA